MVFVFYKKIHVLACCICVDSVYRVTTEKTHLVAAFCLQVSIGQEQIIIAAGLIVHDVRTFDRVVVSAEKFFAIVTVYVVFFVCFRIDRIACFLVNLDQENTAGPGTVNHPHASVFIVKDIRVNTVRPVVVVIRCCCIWSWVCSHQFFKVAFFDIMIVIAGVQESVLIMIRSFDVVCCCKADVGFHVRRCGAEIHHIFSHFFVIDDIRCPYGIAAFIILSHIGKGCRITVFFSVKEIVKQLVFCIDSGGKTGPVSQVC